MNALALVQTADKFTEFLAQDALEWNFFLPDDNHIQPAIAQRCGDFQADEAGADYDRPFYVRGASDNGFAVGQSSQLEDVRQINAFDRERAGLSAGGQQERAVFENAAASQGGRSTGGVDAVHRILSE